MDSKREVVPRSPQSHGIAQTAWTVYHFLICSLASRPSLKISLRLRSSNSLFQNIDWELLDAPLDGVVRRKTIANSLATASLHIILVVFTAAFFPSNRKRSTHCFTMGVSFYSWSRWTTSTNDFTQPVFFLWKGSRISSVYFTYFYSKCRRSSFETSVSKIF